MRGPVCDWCRTTAGHAMLSAAVLWAALPPLDWGWLAWIAPFWWVLLIRRRKLREEVGTGSSLRLGEKTGTGTSLRLGEKMGTGTSLRSGEKTGTGTSLRLGEKMGTGTSLRLGEKMGTGTSLRSGEKMGTGTSLRSEPVPIFSYATLWLAGFLFWLAALHWLRLPAWVTIFGWIALAFYLAFYLPVFIGLARVAVHRLHVPVILAAPVVWTGLELARGHLLGGFTMASLGHTQHRWIELIQVSDLAGAYGVGFVVMLVAACLARMVPLEGRRWAWWPLAPLVVVVAAVLLYGRARTAHDLPPKTVRIALIQGSIDTMLNPPEGTRERMHGQYRRLSEEAVRRYGRLDLIVWPETVFGRPLVAFGKGLSIPSQWQGSRAEFEAALEMAERESLLPLAQLAVALDAPMLVGIDCLHRAAEDVKRFNSAAMVTRQGRFLGRYDKMHLVLFGEYVPYSDRIPWLDRLVRSLCPLGTPGETPQAFDLDGLRVAPNICYESVIPHLIRRQVNSLASQGREPDVLVNLTNDGWFWGSSELDMHLVCGVFRAVECRKPFLIAANTGLSAWIDANGRVVQRGPRRATGTILAQVGRDSRTSWYLGHGDWFAGTCLAACFALAAIGIIPWPQRLHRAAQPANRHRG